MMESYFANKLGLGIEKRQRGKGEKLSATSPLLPCSPAPLPPAPYSLLPTPFIKRFIVRRMYASTGSVVGLKISA